MVVVHPDHGKMETIIRKAVPDDAKPVASVLNSVILEARYTALTNPFTENEERAFIKGLCPRENRYSSDSRQYTSTPIL